MVQNIVPVNKRTEEYNYQLMDTRRYRAKLGRSSWVSMIDLKAGFHNIPFEKESSYLSTFVTHRGRYRWLKMPMGLTQAPAHFQFVVESVLNKPGERRLQVVVYLDDIAVFGDDPAQVLADTEEAIRRLAEAGFMINMKKSQLVQPAAKVLGHRWESGGYWAPEPAKLEALQAMSDDELARVNRSSLYGLLNFYREYVPAFAEHMLPLRELLGSDVKPWTERAAAAVRLVLGRVLGSPKWLNPDLDEEVRVETRVSPEGIAALLLQRDPAAPRTWVPVGGWGRELLPMERLDARVVLELKALREACWKQADICAFVKKGKLSLAVSPELKALLKVAATAHPALQAMLVDLSLYRGKLVPATAKLAPPDLHFHSDIPSWDEMSEALVRSMEVAEKALGSPAMLPPKSRFKKGRAVHVQFDGGSE